MSKWNEYQKFSTRAKDFGGPEAYINFLEDNAKGQGRTEGGIIGSLVTLGSFLVVWGGVRIFNHFKKRKQVKRIAPTVKDEFLSNIEQYSNEDADPKSIENN